MRKLLLAALLSIAAFSSAFAADVYVRGYTRSDGTYVAPHYRSSPNSTRNDNWSTRGNINPHTGRLGTKNPDYNTTTVPVLPIRVRQQGSLHQL